uniref:Uncharacterized protein n=1 Tax=Parastrongyloides trichosuri TaxID=131310 RepID=A0A0N4ZQ05_PARTI
MAISNHYGQVRFDVPKEFIEDSSLYLFIHDKCGAKRRTHCHYERKVRINQKYFKNIFSFKGDPIKNHLFGVIPLKRNYMLGPFGEYIYSRLDCSHRDEL